MADRADREGAANTYAKHIAAWASRFHWRRFPFSLCSLFLRRHAHDARFFYARPYEQDDEYEDEEADDE